MAVIATYTVAAEAAVFDQTVTLDPTAVPKKAVQVETFSVPGLTTTMQLIVSAPALEAALFIVGARVSATDTLELSIWNTGATNINPASQSFVIKGF